MKNLKEMTYQELKHRRDLVVNAKAFSVCDIDRRGFQQAIKGIEKEMYCREVTPAIVMGVLVLAAIMFCTSCRSTITGIGQIAQGAGTVISGAGDYLVEEGKPNN